MAIGLDPDVSTGILEDSHSATTREIGISSLMFSMLLGELLGVLRNPPGVKSMARSHGLQADSRPNSAAER